MVGQAQGSWARSGLSWAAMVSKVMRTSARAAVSPPVRSSIRSWREGSPAQAIMWALVAEGDQETEVAARQILRGSQWPAFGAVGFRPVVQAAVIGGEALAEIVGGGGFAFFVAQQVYFRAGLGGQRLGRRVKVRPATV